MQCIVTRMNLLTHQEIRVAFHYFVLLPYHYFVLLPYHVLLNSMVPVLPPAIFLLSVPPTVQLSVSCHGAIRHHHTRISTSIEGQWRGKRQ